MKRTVVIILTTMVFMLSACTTVYVIMTSEKMDQLELGMSKEQVTAILGNSYKIAEKRIESGNQIEVLSYRELYNQEEYYLFLFVNDKLEKWYRELLPKYNAPTK